MVCVRLEVVTDDRCAFVVVDISGLSHQISCWFWSNGELDVDDFGGLTVFAGDLDELLERSFKLPTIAVPP